MNLRLQKPKHVSILKSRLFHTTIDNCLGKKQLIIVWKLTINHKCGKYVSLVDFNNSIYRFIGYSFTITHNIFLISLSISLSPIFLITNQQIMVYSSIYYKFRKIFPWMNKLKNLELFYFVHLKRFLLLFNYFVMQRYNVDFNCKQNDSNLKFQLYFLFFINVSKLVSFYSSIY